MPDALEPNSSEISIAKVRGLQNASLYRPPKFANKVGLSTSDCLMSTSEYLGVQGIAVDGSVGTGTCTMCGLSSIVSVSETLDCRFRFLLLKCCEIKVYTI